MWRAVVIGCGKIGSEFADDPLVHDVLAHAHGYSVHPRTHLIAVADISPAAASRCGERWNVNHFYTDPIAMLNDVQPHIVSICSPNETHFSLIKATLNIPSVRAIFSEKPLALVQSEAQQLVIEAAKKNVLLAVNYSRRYAPYYNQLRSSVLNGALGQIQRITGYYTKGTLHNGTHWFDLVRFLFGEVKIVQAWNTLKEEGGDPTLDALFFLENGALAMLAALDQKKFSLFEMDIVGTLQRIRIVDVGHSIEMYSLDKSPYYSGYNTLVFKDRVVNALTDTTLHAIENLVSTLEKQAMLLCSGQDALHALEIALALHCSAQQNGTLQQLLR